MDSDAPVDANGMGAAQPAPTPPAQPSAAPPISQALPVIGVGCAVAYTAVFTFLRVGLGRMVGILAIVARLSHVLRDILVMGAYFLAAAILLNFAFRKFSGSWSEGLRLKRFSGWLFLPMIVAVAGFNVLNSEATNWLVWLRPQPAWILRLFPAPYPALEPVRAVVFWPLVEEAFFRGLILGGLLRRYSAPTAILVSTALFTLWHLDPYRYVVACSFGLMAAWIYVRSGSLWPCVILHALGNLKLEVVVLHVFRWKINGFSGRVSGAGSFHPLWFDALGLALLLVGVLGLSYVFNRRLAPAPQGMA